MITTTARPSRTRCTGRAGAEARWSSTCLARRGMLHSECEAVEHIALEAGAVLDGLGRQGAEEVWIVLAGSVRFSQVQRGVDRLVRPGQLILCRDGGDVAVANDGDEPAELLLLQCLPPAAALRLPPRSPVVEGPRR